MDIAKRSVASRRRSGGERKMNRAVKFFCIIWPWWTHVKPVTVKPNNCQLVVITEIWFYKQTTKLNVASGRALTCVGAGDTGEISVLSTQFCCESTLKNQVYCSFWVAVYMEVPGRWGIQRVCGTSETTPFTLPYLPFHLAIYLYSL